VVIKQSWSPFTSGNQHDLLRSEGDIYHHAKANSDKEHHIGRLIAEEVVGGTRTISDFRKNIRTKPYQLSTHQSQVSARATLAKDQVMHETVTGRTDPLFDNALALTERQLCRMVFKDFGYALHRFLSLRELLQTICQCLDGKIRSGYSFFYSLFLLYYIRLRVPSDEGDRSP
jgi:hypothetical protein